MVGVDTRPLPSHNHTLLVLQRAFSEQLIQAGLSSLLSFEFTFLFVTKVAVSNLLMTCASGSQVCRICNVQILRRRFLEGR